MPGIWTMLMEYFKEVLNIELHQYVAHHVQRKFYPKKVLLLFTSEEES